MVYRSLGHYTVLLGELHSFEAKLLNYLMLEVKYINGNKYNIVLVNTF